MIINIIWILEILIILLCMLSDDFWASFWAANIFFELPFILIYISYILIEKKNHKKNSINSNFNTNEDFVMYLTKLQKIFAISTGIAFIPIIITIFFTDTNNPIVIFPVLLFIIPLMFFIANSIIIKIYEKLCGINLKKKNAEKQLKKEKIKEEVKSIKIQTEFEYKENAAILDRTLSECKQEGTLEDIENLKNRIEQNIKYNGSDKEFLELNFIIAKIYNYKNNELKAKEFFKNVKSTLLHLKYDDLMQCAQSSFENNNFQDAIFFFTSILLYQKVKDNKEIPDIYYNRAMIYWKLNQSELAIDDIESAVDKTEVLLDAIDNIQDEDLLKSRLDVYKFKLGNEYTKLKLFKKAIYYYKQISESCNEYDEVQSKILECQKLLEEQELNNLYQGMVNVLKHHIAQKENELKKQEKYIQTNYKKSSNKKINLQSCTEEDLLTIDGFDLSKATKFVKERMNGKVYYDLETFAEDFGLQPHQMIEIQDKIIFPHKPKNKMGRKIDW